MSASLLRSEEIPDDGERLVISGPEGRHGAAALRLKPGENVLVGDGAGVLAECQVLSAAGNEVDVAVRRRTVHARPRPAVTIVQGLPKSERSELAVDLATEAGADEIIPWQADRCISRWTGGKGKAEKGRQKWQNAARAAAKQARRAFEPPIGELVDTTSLTELVADWVNASSAVIVLHEEGSRAFTDLVTSAVGAGIERIVLLVGPEGGVAEHEIAALREAGATPALLGTEVLRTSTAATVALGAIGALTPRWPSSQG